MDSKITLSFNTDVIERAKAFADENNISLSRLTEILLRRITEKKYPNMEELPISDWVMEIAEGKTEYTRKPKSRKELSKEYYKSKK